MLLKWVMNWNASQPCIKVNLGGETQPLTGFTHFVRGIFCFTRLSPFGSFVEGTPYLSRVKCDVRLRIRPYQTHIRRVTITGAGG